METCQGNRCYFRFDYGEVIEGKEGGRSFWGGEGGGGEGRGALYAASAPYWRITLAGSQPVLLTIHCHPRGGKGGDGMRRYL